MLDDQEKQDLKSKIQNNTHEVYVVSVEEMDAIIRSNPKANLPKVQSAWKKLKRSTELGAAYFASAADTALMTNLVNDLGGFGAKAYIKTYGGKPHIIIKGYPGLRNILTGTKYGVQNPKVVSMGLGKAGAVKAARTGGIVTIVLLTTYRVIDFVLTDEATLSQLVGTIATDVVKVGLATGASIAAATVVAGATTIAVGPILAVIVVGVGVSLLLDLADQHFGITDKIIAGLDEMGDNVESYFERKRREAINAVSEVAEEVIEVAVESVKAIAINWVERQLRKYLNPVPRVR